MEPSGNRSPDMDVEREVLLLRIRSIFALAVSCAAHVGLILAAARGASAHAHPADSTDQSTDNWVGETFEVGDSIAGPLATQTAPEPAAPPAPAEEPNSPPPAPTDGPPTTAPMVVRPPPARARSEPHRPRKPIAQSAETSPSSIARPGARAGGTSSPPGSFGMQAPAQPAPRNLVKAFVRAIPVAVSGDPVWTTLPMGNAGSFELKLALGEDGRIVSATPDRAVPEHLRIIGAKTVMLLGSGTFAIRAEPGAGTQRLRISVHISSVETAGSSDPSSAGAYGLGFEPPHEGKPGEAHFTLRSGRHVKVSVRVLEGQ